MKQYIQADIIPFEDEDQNDQFNIARDPGTRPATLERLYNECKAEYNGKGYMSDDFMQLIYAIASNPAAPASLLTDISNTWHNTGLQRNLALNPSTPISLRNQLLSNTYVLDQILKSPDCSENILLLLTSDPFIQDLSEDQLINIACQANLPKDVREYLISEYDMKTDFTIDFTVAADEAENIKSVLEAAINEHFQNDPRYLEAYIEFQDDDEDYCDYSAYVYFTLLWNVSEDDMYEIAAAICNIIRYCGGGSCEYEWEHYCAG